MPYIVLVQPCIYSLCSSFLRFRGYTRARAVNEWFIFIIRCHETIGFPVFIAMIYLGLMLFQKKKKKKPQILPNASHGFNIE